MKKLLFAAALFMGWFYSPAQTNLALYEEFKTLRSAGKTSDAIQIAERLIPAANAAGDTSISINTSYFVSDLYLSQGAFLKALQCLKPAWQMAGVLYKNTGDNYGLITLQLGLAYCKTGDNENAGYYLQQGHDRVAEATNEEGPVYILAVEKMTDCMLWFSQAETGDYIETVLQLTIEHYGEYSATYLSKLEWARNGYDKLGDALNRYYIDKEMVVCYEALKHTNNEDYRYKLWDWFEAEKSFNNHTAAETALTKIDSLDRLWGEGEYFQETVLNKTKYYTELRRLDKAFALAGQLMRLAETVNKNDTSMYVGMLTQIGYLYINLGDYAQAVQYLEKAYLLAKAYEMDKTTVFDDTYQKTIQNLALAYRNNGQYHKSNMAFAEAMRLGNSPLSGKGNLYYYEACLGLGINYIQTAQFDSATLYLNESFAVLPYLEITEDEYTLTVASLQGSLELEKGNYTSAAGIFNKVYPLVKSAPQSFRFNVLTDVYRDMVLAAYYAGEHDKAEKLLLDEYEYYRNFISQNFSALTEAEKSSFIFQYEKNFNKQQAVMFRLAKTNPAIASLWYNKLLLLKGITLFPHYSNSVTTDSAYLANTIQYKAIRETLGKAILDDNTDPVYLKQLQFEANELERKLFINKPDVSVTWDKVKSGLKRGEAAIEFVKIDSFDNQPGYYAALLLTPLLKQPQLVELCRVAPPEEITKNNTGASKSNFINSLYTTRSNELLDDEGTQLLNGGDSLYAWLWKPLNNHLKSISTIYYSPAGIMHRIAFAALPYEKGKLLAQKYTLNLLSSTRSISDEKEAVLAGKAVFIGGIDYAANTGNSEVADTNASRSFESYVGLSSSLVWTNLPGTFEETKALSELYNNKQNLWVTGAAASEGFMKLMDTVRPAILHIATHGYFLPDNAGKQTDPLLRSGLVFAGANNKQKNTTDDGLFTAFEASNLNLSSVQLLVMSACETGLGEVQGSQGVYGLQRAFKMAGVKNIVMSLWQVPDKETSLFMQEFYKRLQAKVPLQKAFAETQLYMAAKYPPFYWAAFVLLN